MGRDGLLRRPDLFVFFLSYPRNLRPKADLASKVSQQWIDRNYLPLFEREKSVEIKPECKGARGINDKTWAYIPLFEYPTLPTDVPASVYSKAPVGLTCSEILS